MKRTVLLNFLLLITGSAAGQRFEMNLDSVHPHLQNDRHGDTIRKYFSNTFYSYPTPDQYPDEYNYTTELKEPYLLIGAFYSNKLAVNYTFAEEKIPELKEYVNDTSHSGAIWPKSYSGKYAIPVLDSSGIIVTVNGISSRNAGRYEFRVLENKTREVLPWTKPTLFTGWYRSTYIEEKNKHDEEVAYLGHFKNEFGKSLTFQVRKIDQPQLIQASLSALWVARKPKVLGVFTFSELSDFLKMFKKQWVPAAYRQTMTDWSSDTTLLKLKNAFEPRENSIIFYLDDIVNSKEVIEYNLVGEGDSTGWKANDFDLNFIWLKDLEPGRYNLKIRYSVQRHNIAVYPFTIAAAWYQTAGFKLGIVLLGLLSAGFVVLLLRSGKQAKLLEVQGMQKQLVQTELRSIRSQFNPHFVFNALNSIQGLMTRKDTGQANKYLAEFSSLMRESLKRSDREFESISKEIKLLENYLNLEQLRFGFSYRIILDEELDIHAMEIPGLLLQPLVENAIKHGVAKLYDKGMLFIRFQTGGANLTVSVEDNGQGFAYNGLADNKLTYKAQGYGLKLTKERIKLLNATLEGQELVFAIASNGEGTCVSIQFKNWLL
ncbi:histidine kinase/DNA gyrase B/HSP90-like ATPase [Anseongella ginsenosidimutans]|uniref:Histidine kinase/DNA gyrase B/HSP90-like ATPase n=1 Tax=Anseongella ginsenosidimutans TaxID=496056 RepID=A0A4R3KXK6_9SPHI|nr:histidine kinase [Anseongella ginsenosidimutans]QEC51828.1 hypothetical protein FRZ59_05390 [Anseongella ginsenosidimutans]TCS89200.1 histidine kinase/DNA gyrase B/HSP90-like ATPase [Anseongella ginsenosidimutans]